MFIIMELSWRLYDFMHIIQLGKVGSALKTYEKPLRWQPLGQPFSNENHMLTPKMSLRRTNVVKAYMPLLEGMYDSIQGHPIVYH